MNILPLIIFFLLLLGLGASTFFHDRIFVDRERTTAVAFSRADAVLRSERERKAFNTVSSKERKYHKHPKEEDEETKDSTRPYTNPRERRARSEFSKFNLRPLIHDEKSSAAKLLDVPAAALIKKLYGKAPFYKEGLEKRILTMLEGKKENSFLDLFPADDQELSDIFFKMLQGTSTGYPPFGDFFTILDTKKPQPINFYYASTDVLEAIIGPVLLEKVAEKEKGKWLEKREKKPLTQTEFQEIVSANPGKGFEFNTSNEIFYFDNHAKGPLKVIVDEKTSISARR